MLVQSLRGERAVTKRGARGERRRDLIEIGDAPLPRVPVAAGMRAPLRGAGAGAVPGPRGGHPAATKSPGAEGRGGRSRGFRSPRGLTPRRQHRPTAPAERLRGPGAPVSAGRAGVAGASRRIPARAGFPHAALVTATLIKLQLIIASGRDRRNYSDQTEVNSGADRPQLSLLCVPPRLPSPPSPAAPGGCGGAAAEPNAGAEPPFLLRGRTELRPGRAPTRGSGRRSPGAAPSGGRGAGPAAGPCGAAFPQ